MRYRAFISYASADRRIGERFQRAIEHYRVPRPLRGTDHGFGPVPKRLTPLFRDRSDASAGRDLGVTLRAALENSDALVVLCSPVSARSKWVNEEIRTFKRLGRNARIFPVLIDGSSRRHDPAHTPDGAFPPALFQRFDADGELIAGDDATPLAPDLRDKGDGLHFARLKIVAALTGVPLTLLTQRQQEAERREKLVVRWVAAVMGLLALLASAAAVQAWRSAEAARARMQDAIEMAARRVDDAAQFQDAYGVPTEVIRQLLDGAEHDFDELITARSRQTPTLELQRGRLSVLFSDLYGSVGDGERQLALARDGLATIEGVTTTRQATRPSTWLARLPRRDAVASERLGALEALGSALANSEDGFVEAGKVYERGRRLAETEDSPIYVARFWSLLGEHRYNSGDLEGALAAQDAAIAALDTAIAKGGDGLPEARRDKALARSDRAEMLLELERHREALAEQSAASDAFQAEAKAAPGDATILRRLAHALVRQEDMRYAVSGDWRPSIPVLERAIAILERLRASDAARIDYARDLSIALERLGDVYFQLGDPTDAEMLFNQAIALKREVLARDPRNADAQRDVAVALERQGDIALAERRPVDALAFLDEARELRDRAGGDADPVATRDMAVLWSRTGQVRASIGGAQNWDEAFSNAILLMRPLTEKDGAPPGWMRDLAVFHAGYGDALAHAGRKADAISQWNAALRLTERQLSLNADDPRLQSDMAILRERIHGPD